MSSNLYIPEKFEYTLLDSGEGWRLEDWASITVVRPDPNVLWKKTNIHNKSWENPDARFVGQATKSGWHMDQKLTAGWILNCGPAKFRVRPTHFRHLGLFPEQLENWHWIHEKVVKSDKPKVLNLFGYTGGASIVAALAGAQVTHVDASKASVYWAKENAELSNVDARSIRWLVDDALKYMRREVRRGSKYDLIIMDPPVFGRGPSGEIWRLEEGIGELVELTKALLSAKPVGVLVNFYATSIYPESFARIYRDSLVDVFEKLELGSLYLEEKLSKNKLCTGYFLRS